MKRFRQGAYLYNVPNELTEQDFVDKCLAVTTKSHLTTMQRRGGRFVCLYVDEGLNPVAVAGFLHESPTMALSAKDHMPLGATWYQIMEWKR